MILDYAEGMDNKPKVEIEREGFGRHRAGHSWRLTIDGRFAGNFDTRRQAKEFADAEQQQS